MLLTFAIAKFTLIRNAFTIFMDSFFSYLNKSVFTVIYQNAFPGNSKLILLCLDLYLVRHERKEQGGTDMRSCCDLWSVWTGLFFVLIRTTTEACLKSVAELSTHSLSTYLKAVCSFNLYIYFFPFQVIQLKVSARNDVSPAKSVTRWQHN